MRFVIIFAALALLAGVAVPHYSMQMRGTHTRPAPSVMAARQEAQAPAPASSSARSLMVPRNGHGQYEVDGRVDGRRLTFVVDTGASVVALTADDAAMLGIHPAAREFSALVRTANGTVRAAPIELATVEIGDLILHDVAAMVLPDGALSDNLLGLSFLSRLERFAFANGVLVLEQ